MVSGSKNYRKAWNLLILLLLTSLAMAVSGYHPGAEDDGVYLPAIKRDLNPALYPHDSDFFTVQLQATVFDKVIAYSVRASHLPLGYVVLAWQFLSVFLILWGCWRIAERCFEHENARWAGVATVAVLLTLPVAGSALYLVDQYLHPRALATAAALWAVVAILDGKRLLAAFALLVALFMHPLMASFAISYCVFLAWGQRPGTKAMAAFAFMPLGWVFEPVSQAWQRAAQTRDYYYISRWQWYEWLGVFAPMILLWWFRRLGRRDGSEVLARMSGRLLFYGCFQLAVAVIVLTLPGLDRLRPFQPMRYLHLLYLLFVLFGGGLIGQHILLNKIWRWGAFLLPLGTVMFFAQRQTFPATRHFEWPGADSGNAWVEAFSWVRQNTPVDSLFALDPEYMRLSGEDFHSFRAFAERSVLADDVKDPSVATQVPRLANVWLQQVTAQEGWKHFQLADFQRLKRTYGVDWVVLERPQIAGLNCPYENRAVAVCRIE
jgi:Domain of unknown function (DUF6798)